jgi:hypothetical protein
VNIQRGLRHERRREKEELTPEDRAGLEAMAAETGLPHLTAEEFLEHIHAHFVAALAASGMTKEEFVKHNLRVFIEMLGDLAAIEEADAIVEPHLTGDDWKLSDAD